MALPIEERISYAKGFLESRIGSADPERQKDREAYELLLSLVEELEKQIAR